MWKLRGRRLESCPRWLSLAYVDPNVWNIIYAETVLGRQVDEGSCRRRRRGHVLTAALELAPAAVLSATKAAGCRPVGSRRLEREIDRGRSERGPQREVGERYRRASRKSSSSQAMAMSRALLERQEHVSKDPHTISKRHAIRAWDTKERSRARKCIPSAAWLLRHLRN
jgi:hypothetical protein